MKKAKIVLAVITLFSVLGSVLAFKSAKRSVIVYFTTTVFNGTATLTLTGAITINVSVQGVFRYYTLLDNGKAVYYSKVTKSEF